MKVRKPAFGIALRVASLAFVLAVAGCACAYYRCGDRQSALGPDVDVAAGVYPAFRTDVEWWAPYTDSCFFDPFLNAHVIIDAGLSVVVDTLLLPYDLLKGPEKPPQDTAQGGRGGQGE